MSKVLLKAAVAIALLAAPSMTSAQTVQDLQQQVIDRDAEIQRLRARLAELEGRSAQPAAPSTQRAEGERPRNVAAAAPAAEVPSDEQDRALERALVRQGGLLLRDGTYEIEPNFVYTHSSADTNSFRRDAYSPGVTFRAGLPLRSQFDITVPYVFERRKSDTTSTNTSGVGDVSMTLSHDFVDEAEYVPAIIGAAGYNFSTGRNTLFTNTSSPVGLGAGFDSWNVGVTAVKRVDPVVYFGGYTFSHTFSGSQDGNSVDLGNTHSVRLGSILAASPFTSLRATMDMSFYERAQFNGRGLSGSDEPSAILTLGGSVLLPPASLLDVGVGAGLTRSSPDFRISVAYPVRF